MRYNEIMITYDELSLLQSANDNKFLKVTIVSNPLVRDALRIIRDEQTDMSTFRSAVYSLTPHLIYAATVNLKEKKITTKTPLATITTYSLANQIVLIPVLRSGIGMHTPAQKIFPNAPTIFAGMARDEATAIPHWYYDLKDLKYLDKGSNAVFLILDPMLATGGSAVETIKRIKEIYPKGQIKMVSLISAPEGIKNLNQAHPDIEITTASVDHHLNNHSYIVPGLGDAGDRQFGTT